VTFTLVTFSVSFAEAGLPASTEWTIVLGGTPMTSSTGGVRFAEPNGTYSYEITGVSGWYQSTAPYTGTVTVAGAAVVEPTLMFEAVVYPITFDETGLPSGTDWWVNLTNGQTFNSTSRTLSFSEPNGTYAWAATSADPAGSSAEGNFSVDGAMRSEFVNFTLPEYPVTFIETGLPAGTNWSVTLNDGSSPANQAAPRTQWSDGRTSMEFDTSSGDYSYSAYAPGYSSSAGNLSVKGGSPAPVIVRFSPLSSPPGATSEFDYVVIGSVVVVAAVGAGAILRRRRVGRPARPEGQNEPPAPP